MLPRTTSSVTPLYPLPTSFKLEGAEKPVTLKTLALMLEIDLALKRDRVAFVQRLEQALYAAYVTGRTENKKKPTRKTTAPRDKTCRTR